MVSSAAHPMQGQWIRERAYASRPSGSSVRLHADTGCTKREGRVQSLTVGLWRGGPRLHFCRHGSLSFSRSLSLPTARIKKILPAVRSSFSSNKSQKKKQKKNTASQTSAERDVQRSFDMQEGKKRESSLVFLSCSWIKNTHTNTHTNNAQVELQREQKC